MKKALLLALLLLSSLFVSAQEHLKFKGIPINGTLNSFVNSLKSQGFVYEASQDGVAILSGTFAGFPKSTVVVVSTNNVVWKVVVLLPEQDTWSSAKQRYEDFKSSFTTKYGVKPVCYEEFTGSSREGSGIEYIAIKDERATWACSFDIPNGTAQLSIKSSIDSFSSLQVAIEYFDTLNSEKRDNATMEDI